MIISYFLGVRFESGRRLLSWLPFIYAEKFIYCASHQTITVSFHIPSKSLFTNHHMILLRATNSPRPLHMALEPPPPPGGQDLIIFEVSRSHSDKRQSVGLPWKNDRSDAKTSSCQHTTFTGDRNPCFRKDSNPQC